MKKIACLDVHAIGKKSQYDIQSMFVKGLHEALIAEGMDSRLLHYDRVFPGNSIEELIKDRPDCLLSFNSILYNDQDEPVCLDLDIPQITVLVDAPYYFLPVLKNPKVIFASYDRGMTAYYQSLGCRNIVFFPHAVDLQDSPDWKRSRQYDVVMPASPIDPEKVRESWRSHFHPAIAKAMDEAGELAFTDPELNAHSALLQCMDQDSRQTLTDLKVGKTILTMIELYFRARDRIELIKAIKDVRVDIFGKEEKVAWKDLIRQDNVVIHGPLEFGEMIKVMQDSKVVLNSTPMIKDGAHERVLAALMSGAAVLSSKSTYLAEQFPEGSGLSLYQPGDYTGVNEQLKRILANEGKRIEEVKAGREIAARSHTWASRAKTIRDEIGPMVDAMKD